MTVTDEGTASTRMEEFERELASLKVRGQSAGPEGRLLILGLVLLAVGLLAVAAAWFQASDTAVISDQMDYLISGGLGGVAIALAGAALYVRAAIARYLRYWLIRLVYEQRAQTDRTVEALERVTKALEGRS